MRRLAAPIAVSVHGDPVTKGSMKCIGQVGRIKHKLIEQLGPAVKKWRRIVDPAGDMLRELAGGVIHAAIGVELYFTLERPATVPLWKRWWPFLRGSGDADKLARCVLDALTLHQDKKTGALHGVLADDAQVCQLYVQKAYPDTPEAADVLKRPGVLIRLYPLADERQGELPYDDKTRTGA